MDTANALDNSFEQFGNQMLDLVDLAHLKDFLQLSQEKGFFDAVGKRPEPEQAL